MSKNSEISKTSLKSKTNRIRVKKTCSWKEIYTSICKASVTKTGLNSTLIEKYLNNCAVGNFLGCYAQNQLRTITIKSLPVYIVVNFDHSYSEGTHWIALRIGKRKLEIWDPLGFQTRRWPNFPFLLLEFLHKFSKHRKIFLCNEIQPVNSTLCGFYCIFFIIFRSSNTFSACTNYFSDLTLNDQILTNFFNKL